VQACDRHFHIFGRYDRLRLGYGFEASSARFALPIRDQEDQLKRPGVRPAGPRASPGRESTLKVQGNGSTFVSILGGWLRRMAVDGACGFPPADRAASAAAASASRENFALTARTARAKALRDRIVWSRLRDWLGALYGSVST
jgi:hypothetical protein